MQNDTGGGQDPIFSLITSFVYLIKKNYRVNLLLLLNYSSNSKKIRKLFVCVSKVGSVVALKGQSNYVVENKKENETVTP